MTRTLKFLLGGMLFSQAVFAQPAPTLAPAGVPAPAPTPGAPAEQADIGVRARATLTPQEMLGQSRDYRSRIVDLITRLDGAIKQARAQKDVILVNCLTDKLVQARANLVIADQAITNLETAVGRADEGATIHEYTRVSIVSQKVQVLSTEADQCAGQDLAFVGPTQVNVDVDPGVRDDDPTQPPFPDLDPVQPVPDSQSPSS